MSKTLLNKYGPWAIVTGASDGIGKAIAEQLAEQGYHLVIVARREETLKELAKSWHRAHCVNVITLSADLSDPASLALIENLTRDLDVG